MTSRFFWKLIIKKILIAIALIFSSLIGVYSQQVLTVTKTTDPDPWLYFSNPNAEEVVGTFQWAIRKANELGVPCKIVFNIPGNGQKIIYLNYDLPAITNNVNIDATTQAGYQFGSPHIVLDGNNVINGGISFYNTSNCIIRGLQVQRFNYNNIVLQNCSNISIIDNVINLASRANANDAASAMTLYFSTEITIKGNFIGTNINNENLGSLNYGILISHGCNISTIGGLEVNEGNVIANNGVKGIWLASGNAHRISRNKIYNNPVGIHISDGVNNNKQAPVITSYSGTTVSGTSQANDIIEIFGSTGNENANEYLANTTADASGNWTTTISGNNWDYLLATATDGNGNSSKLSDVIQISDPCITNPVIANAGANITIITGESVQIGSNSVNGYTYSWLPIEGLNNPNIANPVANPTSTTIYTLTVTDENGCIASDKINVYYEENISYLTPNEAFDYIIDNEGNKHRLKDLNIENSINGSNIYGTKSELLCTSGYFNLYFEVGSGMINGESQYASDRREVICKVFQDISDFINSPLSSNTDPLTNKVNIWIRNIDNLDGISNPSQMPVLGIGTAFHCLPLNSTVGGISDNEIWKTILSGIDSYSNIGAPFTSTGAPSGSASFYHGIMSINFYNDNFIWHTDVTSDASGGNYDLYTVALHEAIHMLGFGSLINKFGFSKLLNEGFNYYSRYDLFLKTKDDISLLVNNQNCSLYDYIFNPSLDASTILQPQDFDCNSHIYFSGIVNQAVYTPSTFSNPNSLSHMEDQCKEPIHESDDAYYLMSETYNPTIINQKRFLQQEERDVLCDLGYNLNSHFGSISNGNMDYDNALCTGENVVGINDGIVNGQYVWITTSNNSIQLSGFISNDINATGFECIQDIYNMGTVDITQGDLNTIVTYTANGNAGTAILRYVPTNGELRGNITYIFIRINSDSCEYDACNMIPNGGFESNSIDCSPSSGDIDENVNCWSLYTSSPDLFGRICNTDYIIPLSITNPLTDTWNIGNTTVVNNHFIGLHGRCNLTENQTISRDEESIQTILLEPIIQGVSYTFSFRAKVIEAENFIALPANIAVCGSNSSLVPNGANYDTENLEILINPLELIVPATNDWVYLEREFVYTGNNIINNFIIGYDATVVAPVFGKRYVLIDDLLLRPTNNDVITHPIPPLCINQTITDLSMYVEPPTGVFSGSGVSCDNNICSFNASVAGVGTHQIEYSYTDNIGCQRNVGLSIIVYEPAINIVTNGEDLCNCQGDAQLTMTEGVSPYTFLWSNGALTSDINNLCAGNYSVTVTDANGCQNNGNISIVNSEQPIVQISVSDNSVCSNENITLSASGGDSYLWSTGSTNNVISENPLVTTTYSVTAYDNNGCYASSFVTINVFSLPEITIYTTNCNQEPASIIVNGGTPPYSYYWDNGTGTTYTTPVVYNAYPGNYNIIVTDANACTVSENITLYEGDAPDLMLQATNSYCGNCTGTIQTVLTPFTNGVTYLWNNGSTSQNISGLCEGHYTVTFTSGYCVDSRSIELVNSGDFEIDALVYNPICGSCNGKIKIIPSDDNFSYTFQWNTGATTASISGLCPGVYSVTVTNNLGCNIIREFTLINMSECCSQNCNFSMLNGKASELIAIAGTDGIILNKNVCIEGIFTIDTDIEFNNNSVIKMGKDAQIYIMPTCTLKVIKTNIEACNEMWNSIIIPHPSSVFISDSRTKITQGKEAVVSQKMGKFYINKTLFYNNIKGLVLRDHETTTGSITNSTFEINTPSLLNIQTTGILIQNITAFNIGIGNKFNGKNKNLRLSFGIDIENSNYITIDKTNSYKFNTIGIRMNNTGSFKASNSTLSINRNDFNNCIFGIRAISVMKDVSITESTMNNIAYDGISVTEVKKLNISDNPLLNNIRGNAITVQNANLYTINSSEPNYKIINNTITGSKNGINISKLFYSMISDNNITLDPTLAGTGTTRGIGVDACRLSLCIQNNITANLNTNNLSQYKNIKAIETNLSQNSAFYCNNMTNIGTGAYYSGNCLPSYYAGNIMENNYDGLLLYNSTIGEQGFAAGNNNYSNGFPFDNQWLGTFGRSHTYMDEGSDGTQNTFYVRNYAPFVPTENHFTSLPGCFPMIPVPLVNFPSSNPLICDLLQQQSTAKSQTIKNYNAEKKIAKNLVNYLDFKPENKWFSKDYLFIVMKNEPEIFDTDNIFNIVYDSLLTTNINAFYNVNEMLNDSLWFVNRLMVEVSNYNIIPQNLIEDNHKKINELYLTITDSLFDSLSNLKYNQLIDIATQCPLSGGDAVYRARAILAMLQDTTSLIFNNCTEFSNIENKSILSYNNLQNNDIKVSLYPNPANNAINLIFDKPANECNFELYNFLGKKVLNVDLKDSKIKYTINIEKLLQGIYIYKIKSFKNEIVTGKVIIIK